MLTVYVVYFAGGNPKMSKAEALPRMKFYFMKSLLMSTKSKTNTTNK